jgi:hypothetical protein
MVSRRKTHYSLSGRKGNSDVVFEEVVLSDGSMFKVMNRAVFDRAIDSAVRKLEEIDRISVQGDRSDRRAAKSS